MGFKVEIKGLDASLKNIDKVLADTKKNLNTEMAAFGFDVVREAKNLVASNSSDEGALLRSISSKNADLEVSIVASVEYAAFIEFGTRKMAAAYVSSLPDDWQEYAAKFRRSAAYPIDRKILRNGIKAKPFLYPAFRDNLPKLKERLKNVIK